MVVVRESSHAKISPDKNNAQWPPKSPFEALLSSPSGRKRWQDRQQRHLERSPSPSPVKRPLSSSKALEELTAMDEDGMVELDDLDEEERKAMLELEKVKLELRLSKIRQRKKLAAMAGSSDDATLPRSSSRADSAISSPRRGESTTTTLRSLRQPEVEVPLSPVRERAAPSEQLSPARRRLGLTTMPNAHNVSLKRARSGAQVKQQDTARAATTTELPRPRSFNERLQASKREADHKEEKHDRVDQLRSKSFKRAGEQTTSAEDRVAGRRAHAPSALESQRPSSAYSAQVSTLDESPSISRSNSIRSRTPRRGLSPQADIAPVAKEPSRTQLHAQQESVSAPKSTQASHFEPFSEVHLSKRHIPHPDIARAMDGKEIYTLPRLLKEVKAPHYEPPDCETDFVIFAILASKSSPFDQKSKHRTSDENKAQEDANAPRNKFMVLHLCDLKWEVDCFLFGTAFDQFWKLTPGTLLAILNPAILPPKGNQHNGRFSLKLASSDDCVMEIGTARDLGYCNSIRKDGTECASWIDKRSTSVCDFHLNLYIEKQRKGRMEVNTMWRSHAGTSDNPNKSRSREQGGWDQPMDRQRGVTHHPEYGRLYSVKGAGGGSTASLLDKEGESWLEGCRESEASRKRIAARQRERDLERELKALDDMRDETVGAEYLRANHKHSGANATRPGVAQEEGEGDGKFFAKPSAAELGLLANRASDVHISPLKSKSSSSLRSTGSTRSSAPMGWGGARKAGLLMPPVEKEKEKQASGGGGAGTSSLRTRSRSRSPEKKRARFMLAEKGLREPGRESGGQDLRILDGGDGEEDDDGLDIV